MEACNDERTQYWLAGMPSPYQLTDAEAFIESRQENLASGEGVSWAIADPVTDDLLGNVSVFDLRNRIDLTSGEIGYWLHPEARGRGVMTDRGPAGDPACLQARSRRAGSAGAGSTCSLPTATPRPRTLPRPTGSP